MRAGGDGGRAHTAPVTPLRLFLKGSSKRSMILKKIMVGLGLFLCFTCHACLCAWGARFWKAMLAGLTKQRFIYHTYFCGWGGLSGKEIFGGLMTNVE